MMAHARSRGRARRPGNSPQHGGWLIFTRPQQHWLFRLLGLIIRARAELTLITITVTVYINLREYYGPEPVLIGTGLVTVALLAIPVSRRYVYRRLWCVITRRRLRACMIQTFTMARANGRLPFLLWARPSPVGEHVLVWLPAGMAVKDLERITGELAAACWAQDARIIPSTRRASFAHIHVVRRDTLSRVDLVPEVIDELDHHPTTDTTAGSDTGTAQRVHPYLEYDTGQLRAALAALTPGINHPPATSDTTAAANGRSDTNPAPPTRRYPPGPTTGKPTTARTATEKDTGSAVTGYGGFDVSDYV